MKVGLVGWLTAAILAGLLAIETGCSRRNNAKAKPAAVNSRGSQGKAADPPRVYVPPAKPGKPFTLEMAPGVTMEFMNIPPGSFMMGDASEGIPRHKETIAGAFYLAKTEVTQEQWRVLMTPDPSPMKGPGFPVHRVDWDGAQAFVSAMNEKYASSGMRFGLPSETQWEYACKAGNTLKLDTPDDPARIEQYAWLGSNSHYEPHPVGQKKANDWGLFDMQGNIAEFCADVFRPGPDGRVPGLPTTAPDDGSGDTWHVVRGGNYRDGVSACLSTSRLVRRGIVPLRYDGLRLACEPRP